MIDRIRRSSYLNLFWGAMAVFLLNLSVDAPDPLPRHVPEDLTHNEQESIAEWVVEQVLGYTDAFAEYDDEDGEERASNAQPHPDATLNAALAFTLRPPVERRNPALNPPDIRWQCSDYHAVAAPPPRS